MNVLRLELNGKVYMTGKLTAFISKEALKLQRDSIEFAKKAKEIQNSQDEDIENISYILQALSELRDKKSWLICEAYGNQFTVNDIENEFSVEEIESEVNKILYGVTGIITKN